MGHGKFEKGGWPAERALRRVVFALGLLVWTISIVAGVRILFKYENTPGMSGTPERYWPSDVHVARSTAAFTLVLLAHPDCPCTRASLAELEEIVAKSEGKLTSYVIFSKPGARDAEIESAPLWKTARGIPKITVIFDATGTDTGRFGGHVSGQTMLYDRHGLLVFSGGITTSRGHEGVSDGTEAILGTISARAGSVASTPVFGCSLHNPSASEPSDDPSWKSRW